MFLKLGTERLLSMAHKFLVIIQWSSSNKFSPIPKSVPKALLHRVYRLVYRRVLAPLCAKRFAFGPSVSTLASADLFIH